MKLSEFNEVYDKYYLMVMKVAFNLLHDYSYAQDVCQEVFLQFYAKGDEIDMKCVKAWLMVTAQRKSIDFTRKKYIKNESCDLDSGRDFLLEDMVCESCVQKVLGEEVLRKLFEKDRLWFEIIYMVLIEHESQQTVAEALGISLSNLRIKLFRAKAWIRKNYPHEDIF